MASDVVPGGFEAGLNRFQRRFRGGSKVGSEVGSKGG